MWAGWCWPQDGVWCLSHLQRSPLPGVTLRAPKPGCPSGIVLTPPPPPAISIRRTQTLCRCVPMSHHCLWGVSGQGDPPQRASGISARLTGARPPAPAAAFASQPRAQGLLVVAVAVAGATCPVYLGTGTGTPWGGVRRQSKRCCKGMWLHSPPSLRVSSGWCGGVGCFSMALLLPPPHRAVNTQLSTSAWSCLPCRCW